MKRTTGILLFLALLAAVYASKTKVEVVKPTTEYDDSKPNSANVPDVYTLTGRIQRVVVFRFKYKADLLEGLKKAVEKEKVRNAVILSGIGSVRNYHIHTVSNREFPSKNFYIKDPTTPADLVSMNGYIIDGRVHAHVTLADDEEAFGGHLEPGTEVFTFAVITVGIFSDDVDLSRVDDKTYR